MIEVLRLLFSCTIQAAALCIPEKGHGIKMLGYGCTWKGGVKDAWVERQNWYGLIAGILSGIFIKRQINR